VIYKEDSLSFSRTAENIIKLRIFNPYKHTVKINHPELPVIFQAGFYNSDGYLELKKNIGFSGEFAFPAPGDTIKVSGKFSLEELPAGDFNFVILSETGILYDTFSSKFCKATFR